MAEVRLSIAGREYIVTCRDGEEDRLIHLGQLVDAKAREAGGAAGGLNESRLLLFAALLLADQVQDSGGAPKPADTATAGIDNDQALQMAQSLEKLAERIETFASGLEDKARDA
ncbi:MAG: cell division protein ZapA [Sphingomonadales bacterium]|nr:cell division protein ZapA [Sphingomonadales bacterium]